MKPFIDNAAEYYTSNCDPCTQNVNNLLCTKVVDADEIDAAKYWQQMFGISKKQTTALGDGRDAFIAAISCARVKKRDCASLPADWDSGILHDDTITQAEA